MLGIWFIFLDRELLVAYAVTICMVAVVAYFTRRIWLEADPFVSGLNSSCSTQDSATATDERVTEYPQSGVPGRWQWRSE